MKNLHEIVVATGNRNKLAELRTVGDRCGVTLLPPEEARARFALPPVPDPEETGGSFAENALIKARAFMEWSGRPSLGDDSGLEIDALDGRPGIFSARYAGPGASDAEKIGKVLRDLEEAQQRNPAADRRARFRCALALVGPGGLLLEADGALEGTVLHEPRGTAGFGYDPIILIDELEKTLAEVSFEITCRNGFRARAAEKLFALLKQVES